MFLLNINELYGILNNSLIVYERFMEAKNGVHKAVIRRHF